MQNAYQYWRAAHPLLFITIHLLLGIIIAREYLIDSCIRINFIPIVILLFELLLLIRLNKSNKYPFSKGIVVFLCLVSWGVILQCSAVYNLGFTMPNFIDQFILHCSNGFIEKINKTIISKEANGFALALLIGVKMDMNKALVNAYTQLGIIHIIAISGMHLDILFKSLTKITNQLPKKRMYQILEITIILLLVWTYTLMANASPSIVRASVFFSIFIIGKFYEISSFTLNSIAGGILLLLLMNIKGIEHIGLQLSYAAVIGIHLFYKIFYTSIDIQNPLIRFLWGNCCISLAAQLTTFPIIVLHFHQVASWVLISNFIMVPLSTIILYGLLVLLILPVSIATYWGIVMEQYILFFNGLVYRWFVSTKAGTIHFSMNVVQVSLYYVLLLLLYLWIYQKKGTYLIAILSVFTGLALIKLFS
jgi:competence protein ComEC